MECVWVGDLEWGNDDCFTNHSLVAQNSPVVVVWSVYVWSVYGCSVYVWSVYVWEIWGGVMMTVLLTILW